jgi:acyl-CoA thioesterase
MSGSESSSALAAAVSSALYARDTAAQHLGIEVQHCGPGHATLTMTVRNVMLNGHGICHGGFIFSLADTAFAYACNSGNELTVAQHCSIDFLRPARAGEHLTATAREVTRRPRSGIYDVTVCGPDGEPVALFRGLSRSRPGTPVIDDTQP